MSRLMLSAAAMLMVLATGCAPSACVSGASLVSLSSKISDGALKLHPNESRAIIEQAKKEMRQEIEKKEDASARCKMEAMGDMLWMSMTVDELEKIGSAQQ